MNTSSSYDIKEANKVLLDKLTVLLSVEEWARAIGYQVTARFSREYRNCFGERPKSIMIKARIKKAK